MSGDQAESWFGARPAFIGVNLETGAVFLLTAEPFTDEDGSRVQVFTPSSSLGEMSGQVDHLHP